MTTQIKTRASLTQLGRRASPFLISQLVSSATNLFAALAPARMGSTNQFGSVGYLLLIYGGLLGLVGVFCVQPAIFAIREQASSLPKTIQGSYRLSTRLAVMVGAATIGFTALLSRNLLSFAMVMGLAFPGLALFEAIRQISFAELNAFRAMWMDLYWAIALACCVILLAVTQSLGALQVFIAWALSGHVSLLLVVRRAWVPTKISTFGWLREQRKIVGPLGSDVVVSTATNQAAASVVLGLGGTTLVAGWRGAMLLVAPAITVLSALDLVAMPRLGVVATESQRFERTLRKFSYVALAIGLSTCLLFLIPNNLGLWILNRQWPETRAVLFVGVATSVARAAVFGPVTKMMLPTPSPLLPLLRALDGVITLTSVVLGSAFLGTRGSITGIAVARGLSVLLWSSCAAKRATLDGRLTAMRSRPSG